MQMKLQRQNLHFLHKTVISLRKKGGEMICKDINPDYIFQVTSNSK